MSNHVRMFKPQFAPLVESGAKCQTVRPTPKRMPKAGDKISLRMWTGKPYRSKQQVLRESVISAVEKISICDTGRELLVSVGNQSLTPEELNAFAVADGFKNAIEMCRWFNDTHGLPFEGVVIKWYIKTPDYATAMRDGFTVPLIGIPASAAPSKGDFNEANEKLASKTWERNR